MDERLFGIERKRDVYKRQLQNLDFAYNFGGVSVPVKFKMEIFYKLIRRSAEKRSRITVLRII